MKIYGIKRQKLSQATAHKVTLAALQQRYRFNAVDLARRSRVAPVVVTSMLQGRAIYPLQARKILNELTLMKIPTSNVEMVLYEE
jgi:hypothetical protein